MSEKLKTITEQKMFFFMGQIYLSALHVSVFVALHHLYSVVFTFYEGKQSLVLRQLTCTSIGGNEIYF